MSVPSIEERLRKAIDSVTLLRLALCANAEEASMDVEDVVAAVKPVVAGVSEELYFLEKALENNAGVLNRPAPGLDDVQDR